MSVSPSSKVGLIFTVAKKRLPAETSFAQLLNQSGGTLCVRPDGQLAAQAPQSSWDESA